MPHAVGHRRASVEAVTRNCMLPPADISRDRRGILLTGAIICGVLLLLPLAVSDFSLMPLQTLRSRAANGDTIIETRYNPLGIVALAIPAILVFGGLALLLALPVLRVIRHLRRASAFDRLERELAGLLALVRAHLMAREKYTHSLANAQSRLAELSGAEQVRVIVSLLVAENERMRRDNADYQGRIEDCARQIETLQSNLSGAEEAALKDPLTGTGNRRSFDAVITKTVQDSNEQQKPASLIMCDIDHFKRVNDAFGHQVGDEVIKLLAHVIESNIRETDTVIRYGGEEFAIILPTAEREAATSIAERIRRQFEAKRLTIRETNQNIGQLTASFGVAQHRTGDDVDTFVQRADAKLYEAKASGRNRVAT